jgi:outer membrane protein assembly factor BamB
MTIRKPLRVWPGVVVVVLQWLARFGIKEVVPGFQGFAMSAMGGIIGVLAVLLWWLFFSRAAWVERLGAIVLMIAAMGATWGLNHESMGPFWAVTVALPVLSLAFVGWAVATRHLPDGTRRATMAATIILSCGVWTLARMEGISGDHVPAFAWRWSTTPEERAVAEARDTAVVPAPPAAAPAAAPVPSERGSTRVEGLAPSAAAAVPAAPAIPKASVEWPGFRGPNRDGVVRGVRIETDWSKSPPVELWRRPVGPGWSSFAVRGNFVYTQEQRAADETVTCYDASTGRPVWTHRDAARFFESNAGAGPRGTPALSQGRVFTFGATGILNALDAGNGTVVWSRKVTADSGAGVPTWGFSSSPLVVDDLVIVAAAGQLLAYDLATGAPRWSGSPDEGYSSPHLVTLGGVAQILLISNTGTTSVAPADGKVLWKHAWGGSPMVQPNLTADGDLLIAAHAGSGVRRLNVSRGSGGWTEQERWTSMALKPYFNDFVVHKGHAYGFDARIMTSIDLQDGQRKWKGGRYGNGQLVLLPDQDLLLVLSEEGELALVSATPDRFSELARFKAIEGKTWNHPVLAGDILLVRNGEEMAAFRLPSWRVNK